MSDFAYFVMVWQPGGAARAYGTRNHHPPADDDPRCIWRGEYSRDAQRAAKEYNEARKSKRKLATGPLFGERK